MQYISTKNGFGNMKADLGRAGLIATSVRLWQRIAKEGRNWSLILEDDVVFNKHFASLFKDSWAQIGEAELTPSVVYLGWCQAYSGKVAFLDGPTTKRCIKIKAFSGGHPECTHAYLISLEGVKHWLEHFTGKTIAQSALDMELTALELKGDVLGLADPKTDRSAYFGLVQQLSAGVNNPSDIGITSADGKIDSCNGMEVKAKESADRGGVRSVDVSSKDPLLCAVSQGGCTGTTEFTFAEAKPSGDAAAVAAAAPQQWRQCLASLGLPQTGASSTSDTCSGAGTKMSVSAWLAQSTTALSTEAGCSKHPHCGKGTAVAKAITVLKEIGELPCGFDFLVFATGVRLQGTADVVCVSTALTAQISTVAASASSPSSLSATSATALGTQALAS
jgi:hypothetical protein